MTTEISHISVQYTKTIGRGEQFGPGFNYPVYVARGQEGIMYVLCRGTEFRQKASESLFAQLTRNTFPHLLGV